MWLKVTKNRSDDVAKNSNSPKNDVFLKIERRASSEHRSKLKSVSIDAAELLAEKLQQKRRRRPLLKRISRKLNDARRPSTAANWKVYLSTLQNFSPRNCVPSSSCSNFSDNSIYGVLP
jgi:hypothetical protein